MTIKAKILPVLEIGFVFTVLAVITILFSRVKLPIPIVYPAMLSYLIFVLIWNLKVMKRKPHEIGLTMAGWKRNLPVGLACGLAFVFSFGLIFGWDTPPKAESSLAFLRGVLLTLPLVAISEEVVFRGYLISILSKEYGKAAGVIGSSVLFGLAHVFPVPSLASWFWTMLIGLILGILFVKTKGIVAPAAFHYINDAVLTLYSYLLL